MYIVLYKAMYITNCYSWNCGCLIANVVENRICKCSRDLNNLLNFMYSSLYVSTVVAIDHITIHNHNNCCYLYFIGTDAAI